jgi:sugar phosphate isomerase/epimerase
MPAVGVSVWMGRLHGAQQSWLMGSNTAIEGFGLIEAIRAVKQLGFEAIEIQPMGVMGPVAGKFPGFEFDRLTAGQKNEIRSELKGFRVVTAHLPYTGLDWMSAEPEKRAAAVQRVEVAMEAAAFFGARLAVLHPQPLPAGEEEKLRGEYLRRFREWGDRAKRLKFQIALETGYPRSVREYVRLVQEIDHEAVGATIDVGHQRGYAELLARVKPEKKGTAAGIRAYNDTTVEIMEKLGKKVFHLHVHDIEPATWNEHKPLIHGFVDYPRMFGVLRKIGYQGVLLFEIGGRGVDQARFLTEAQGKMRAWMER